MFDRFFYKEHLVLFLGFLFFMSRNDLGISQENMTFARMSNQQLITSTQANIVLEERVVPNSMICALWCLRNSLCLSFNFEKEHSKLQHKVLKCELLSIDGKSRPDLAQESNTFDYYAISDPCHGLNCLNGGTCVTSTRKYRCICADGYEGTHCEIISECVHYKNLSEDNRNINHGYIARKCDTSSIITSGKWYRFTGPAGSRMLDTCPTNRCDTDFQGWLKEGQPSHGEVRVTRTVCFQGNNRCCNWPKEIKATHCGAFIAYQLSPLNCYIRYCGTD